MAKHNPFDQRGSKRKWAADTIQGAWRSYKKAKTGGAPPSLASTQSYGVLPYVAHGGVAAYSAARSAFAAFKPKFKSSKGLVLSAGVGGSKSTFSLVKPTKVLGKKEKVLAPIFYVRNLGTRTTSIIGKQNAFLLGSYFTPTDVQGLAKSIFGTTPQLTNRVICNSVHADIMIVNQENSTCWYTIWDVLAKHDGSSVAVDPVTTFLAGFVDNTSGGTAPAAVNALIPGVTPQANPRNLEYYKVLQRTEGTIESGQTHVHTIYYAPQKLIGYELTTNTSNAIEGLTLFSFIVYHGGVMNDSTTKTQVSLGAMNLDVVEKAQFKGKILSNSYENSTITNSLALSWGVAGETMNEFTGTAQADTLA